MGKTSWRFGLTFWKTKLSLIASTIKDNLIQFVGSFLFVFVGIPTIVFFVAVCCLPLLVCYLLVTSIYFVGRAIFYIFADPVHCFFILWNDLKSYWETIKSTCDVLNLTSFFRRVSIISLMTLLFSIFGCFGGPQALMVAATTGFIIGLLVTLAIEEESNLKFQEMNGGNNYVAPPAARRRNWSWEGWSIDKGPSEDNLLREDNNKFGL